MSKSQKLKEFEKIAKDLEAERDEEINKMKENAKFVSRDDEHDYISIYKIPKLRMNFGRLKQLKLQLKEFLNIMETTLFNFSKTLYSYSIRKTPKDPTTWTLNVR